MDILNDIKFSVHICTYLEVNEVVTLLFTIRRLHFLNKEELVTLLSSDYGKQRTNAWKILLSVDNNGKVYAGSKKKYKDYVKDDKLSLSSSGQQGEIMRDVVRTFPCHPYFKSGQQGESMLARILQAAAVANDEVGYCQGMNFICGALLLCRLGSYQYIYDINYSDDEYDLQNTKDNIAMSLSLKQMFEIEEDVFDIMLLLSNKDSKLAMCGLWQSDTPKMKLRVFQMDKALKWILPKLHAHFEAIQLAPEILVSQWFITIFCYTLPTTLTFSIWDHIFVNGWTAMFRVLLALLQILESEFLSTDLECIGRLMRQWKKKGNILSRISHHQLIQKANSIAITDEMLKEFEESYALEMFSMSNAYAFKDDVDNNEREKSSWLMRYGETIDESTFIDMKSLQNELSTMDEQIENDKSCIQSKIVRACEQYREMQQKYNTALRHQSKCVGIMKTLETKFKAALLEAQNVAEEAASDLDTSKFDSTALKDNKIVPSFEPLQAAISSFFDTNLFGMIKKRTFSQGSVDLTIESNDQSPIKVPTTPVSPIHTPKSKTENEDKGLQAVYDDNDDFVIILTSDPMTEHAIQSKTDVQETPSRRRITNTKFSSSLFNASSKDNDVDGKQSSLLSRSSSNSTLLQSLGKSGSIDSEVSNNDVILPNSSSQDSNDSNSSTKTINFNISLKIPTDDFNTITQSSSTTITPTTPTTPTTTSKLNMISSAFRSAMTSLSISPHHENKLKMCSERSQKCQQKIITLHRSLENAKNDVLLSNAQLRNAQLQLEESLEVKNAFSKQLQNFQSNNNQKRKEKLQNIANNVRI